MSDAWTCGTHHDSDPPFAETILATPCMGDKKACSRPVVIFFAALDEADGSHPIPPLCFTATCVKHRQKVGRVAAGLSVGWFGLGEVLPRSVPALLTWFHGPSGLCLGDRALTVVSPGAPNPRAR